MNRREFFRKSAGAAIAPAVAAGVIKEEVVEAKPESKAVPGLDLVMDSENGIASCLIVLKENKDGKLEQVDDFERVKGTSWVRSVWQSSPSLVTKTLLATVLMFLLPGCSFLMPGLSTRSAMESRVDTTWDDTSLRIAENTTSTTDTLTAEGENVEITWDAKTGKPLSVSGATHVLRQTRDPSAAGNAFSKLAVDNAKVAGQMMQTISSIASAVLPLVAKPTPSPTTQPVGE